MSEPRMPAHFVPATPEGDDRERLVCSSCGYVHYRNPKIVVGSIVRHGGRILLCRRAIEPRRGFWTLPAGYMEFGEMAEDAARREAREEACAEISIDRMLAVYSIPRIGQVQIMYLASLAHPNVGAGPESLEVGMFGWDDIPWTALSFPSVRWALTQYRSVEHAGDFAPFANPAGERGNYR